MLVFPHYCLSYSKLVVKPCTPFIVYKITHYRRQLQVAAQSQPTGEWLPAILERGRWLREGGVGKNKKVNFTEGLGWR